MRTTSGWLARGEVVEVEFDPEVISFEELVKRADERKVARRVYTRTEEHQEIARRLVGERAVRTDDAIRVDDDKYYVSKTPLRHVPMTHLQATSVNARVGARKPIDDLLSPRQLALLAAVKARPDAGWPVAIGRELPEAWAAARKILEKDE